MTILAKVFIALAWLIPGPSHRWARKVRAEGKVLQRAQREHEERFQKR